MSRENVDVLRTTVRNSHIAAIAAALLRTVPRTRSLVVRGLLRQGRTGEMKFNVGQSTAAIPTVGITIRRLSADDAAAVTWLAQRDTARAPRGELLGAELDGQLVAAISTTTGEAIADPFRRTAEIVECCGYAQASSTRVQRSARACCRSRIRLRAASRHGHLPPYPYRGSGEGGAEPGS
jgi:hypothetical protein